MGKIIKAGHAGKQNSLFFSVLLCDGNEKEREREIASLYLKTDISLQSMRLVTEINIISQSYQV